MATVRKSGNTSKTPKCAVSHCEVASVRVEPGGMCSAHFQQSHRGKDPEKYETPQAHASRRDCWVEECQKPVSSHSLCHYHAKRVRIGRLEVPESLGATINPPCSFGGCDRPYLTQGLCHTHDAQARSGKELTPISERAYIRGEYKCERPRCSKPASAKGVCRTHYRHLTKYRLTTEQYLAIWAGTPRCANDQCGNTTRLHHDHDHETGLFRALLCGGCNAALGQVKEDPERLRGLAGYIEGFQ